MTCVASSSSAPRASLSVPSPPVSTHRQLSSRPCAEDVYFDVYRAVILAEKSAEAAALANQARDAIRRDLVQRTNQARMERQMQQEQQHTSSSHEEHSKQGRMGAVIDRRLRDLRASKMLVANSLSFVPTASLGMLLPILLLLDDANGGAEVDCIMCQGQELWPALLTPDGSGVEFRSLESARFQTASAKHLAQVSAATKQRADDIAAAEEMLHRILPAALKASTDAMHALMSSAEGRSDPDPKSDLAAAVGAMTLEQDRLRRDIEAQRTRLQELLVAPAPAPDLSRQDNIEEHVLFNALTLSFADGGTNLVDGVRYTMLRRLQPIQMIACDTVVEATGEGKPQA